MRRIITSILDDDLYKFTMMLAVILKFPWLRVKYAFYDRNNQVYPAGFDNRLRRQVEAMKDLELTKDEALFLRSLKFLPHWFVAFIKGYRFDPNEVNVVQDKQGHLHITIEGFWYRTILWEVVLLAMISELFYEETGQIPLIDEEKNKAKLALMHEHNAFFAEFGTRRRFSKEVQDNVIGTFVAAKDPVFVGASNVHFAHKYGIKPIGTMAHEWIMAHGALYGYKMANTVALDNWADVYGGDLGIALPDTYTTDVFLRSFDLKHAKLYDGVRQDSGDPFKFVDKIVKHYDMLGIDPKSKLIVPSNALTTPLAAEIKEYCVGKIKCSSGIGTDITNDVGVKPMNIVIKLSHIWFNGEWIETIKLSDDTGKHTGSKEEVELAQRILKLS